MYKSIKYLGKSMPIRITIDQQIKKTSLIDQGDYFEIFLQTFDEDQINLTIKRYYMRSLKKIVQDLIEKYQPYFKVKPRQITIESSLKKWGTCTSKRELMFNWHLMVAPPEVIEYVVVHELCHMTHMNHDRSFWRMVGKLVPDYKKSEAWLNRDPNAY